MNREEIHKLSLAINQCGKIIAAALNGVSANSKTSAKNVSPIEVENVLIDVVSKLAENEKIVVTSSGVKNAAPTYNKAADILALAHVMFKRGDKRNAIQAAINAFEAADCSMLMQAMANINAEAASHIEKKIVNNAKTSRLTAAATSSEEKTPTASMRARRRLSAKERFSEGHGKDYVEPDTSLLDFATQGNETPNNAFMDTDDQDQYLNPENLSPHDLDVENRPSNVVGAEHSTEEDYGQTGELNSEDYKKFMQDPKVLGDYAIDELEESGDDNDQDEDDDADAISPYLVDDDDQGLMVDDDYDEPPEAITESDESDEIGHNPDYPDDTDEYKQAAMRNNIYDEMGSDLGERIAGEWGAGATGYSRLHASKSPSKGRLFQRLSAANATQKDKLADRLVPVSAANTVKEFGKSWSKKLPRNDIRWLIDRQHVSTPEEEIRSLISKRIAKSKDKWPPHVAKQAEDFAVLHHKRNIDLFHHVNEGGKRRKRAPEKT